MRRLREIFSEKNTPITLFILALAAHFAAFFALLSIYGPCSFFLSRDCTLNGNDTQHYVIIAENLTHGHGYSRFIDAPFELDALRTPLLPLYFAPFTYFGDYSLIWLAILLLNIVLSLAPIALYKFARFFMSHGYALLAGIFMTFEPLYLYRSQIAEPDALLILLVISAAYFLVRSWKSGRLLDISICAFLLGLAILAKPTAAYLAGIMVFFEILHLSFFSDVDHAGRLKRVIALFGIIIVLIFPWLARNKIAFNVAGLSSIQGYNLYEYYTKDIRIEGDDIPSAFFAVSREPSRYMPFQKTFVHVSLMRIRAHPAQFAKEMAVGVIRNLFVSDISQIYYYGHSRILPFPYDPESRMNIHELLLSGDAFGALRALFSLIPKAAWFLILALLYSFAFIGWLFSWRDRATLLAFTMSLCMFGYLIFASGPFVDAKYRLPALPLIATVALYGVLQLKTRYALRRRAK